jgi:hypothetical protein
MRKRRVLMDMPPEKTAYLLLNDEYRSKILMERA